MKAILQIEKEIEIKTLRVEAGVRYYEDATVNGVTDTDGKLIPCKKGELWCPLIDIDTGIITNWKQGTKAEIHYKVCDAGNYFLLDVDGETVLSIEDGYVPSILYPKEEGYGDYIIMDVDENGKISDWKINRELIDEFIEQD